MRRRDFITAIAGSAATWPLAANAQQPDQMRRIGILMGYRETDTLGQAVIAAFQDRLQKLGWMPGHNVRLEIRWAPPGDREVLQRAARELVALQPDLILSHSTPTTATLLQQTRSIPIIFAFVSDPLGSGFVASFAHPGGNVTGFTVMEPGLAGKWVELLKDVSPRISRAILLFNPATAPYAEYYLKPFNDAALSLGVEGIGAPVHDSSELTSTIAAQAGEANGGLVVMPDAFTDTYRAEITSLASRYRVPGVYPFRYWAELGGLLSYGVEQADNFRRAALYVDRVLKGEKPSELPVQAPVKFELVVNLKTAKTMGFTVPFGLLNAADDVIE
jgi:putative ABC transport system substrate-binding protein